MRLALSLFLFSLTTASAAVAQDAPAPAATPAPAPEKKTCRSEIATGSIMPGKKVCHTKSEWAAINAQNERDNDTFAHRATRSSSPGN